MNEVIQHVEELEGEDVRRVVIHQTRGTTNLKIQITEDVKTFGQLRNLFEEHSVDFDFNKYVAVCMPSRVEFSMDSGLLPQEDFAIVIMPRQTKGGTDRKALYERIKAVAAIEGKDFVKFFFQGNTGKDQYTRISNAQLLELVPKLEASVSKTVADVVESVKVSKPAPAPVRKVTPLSERLEKPAAEDTDPLTKAEALKGIVSEDTYQQMIHDIKSKLEDDKYPVLSPREIAALCKEHPRTKC